MSPITDPKPHAHEFALMLALSTTHMSPGTAADWMPRCPWACFPKGEWGWFMYVCDDAGVTEAADIPLEIRSALHVARKLRCQWIMWDCDAPIVADLPEYDWGAATGEVS